MLEKFRYWYLKNHTEITWFLIGWLSIVGLQDLAVGNYGGALFSFALVALNYALSKR